MQWIARTLALSTLGVVIAPFGRAQTIGTLTCTDEGGAPTITSPVFAFNVNTDKSAGVLDATVYLDISAFPILLPEENSFYTSCVIANGAASISMHDAAFADVSAAGAGAGVQSSSSQLYASTIFTFDQLTVGGVTISAKGAATPEARAKAVAAAKARGLMLARNIGVQ